MLSNYSDTLIWSLAMFLYSVTWILLVHVGDTMVEKKYHLLNEFEDKKKDFRMITAAGSTIISIIMSYVYFSLSLDELFGGYTLSYSIFKNILVIVILNFILFGNNWKHILCDPQSRMLQLDSFQSNPKDAFIKLIFCPVFEEVLFSVLPFTIYKKSVGEPSVYFFVSSAVIFAGAHIHMVKDQILDIITDKGLSSTEKREYVIKSVVGVTLMPFIFRLYSSWVMYTTQNFWPCFLIHAFCNFTGGPILKERSDGLYHMGCIAAFFGLAYKIYG